jgi:hypothetical protein
MSSADRRFGRDLERPSVRCDVRQAEQDADCSPPGYQALASRSPAAVGRVCRAIALVGIGERLNLLGRGEAVKVGDDAKQVLACPWKRSRR